MSQEEQLIKAYDDYADAIYRFCVYRVYNHELAKDLVSETFTKTWDYMVKGNEVKNTRALLYRVARNLIIDYSRKKKEQSLDQLIADQGESVVGWIDNQAECADAALAIEKLDLLSKEFREVIALRYLEGYGPKEIAEILGKPATLISVRLNRALRKLNKLVEHGPE
ncbi:MAG: sigma-70 family RNA polymerase sigma factor [Patescibacteria group bacterium]|nr:sigma-70 family RNA polymerase sigma factor [Patescibacteria group bacterium]